VKILETDHWCLVLPAEWWAEHDDDIVRIVDKDEVGELEVTTLCKQTGDVEPEELLTMAEAESPEVREWQPITLGAFAGVTGRFIEDGASIREFYMAASNILLYITYICDEEDAGMDDAPVEELLATLVLGDAHDSATSTGSIES
jgi:hypothetical protein